MKAFHGSRNPIPNTVNPHRTINAPLRLFVCVRVPLFISSTTAGTCNDDSAAIASVSLSFELILLRFMFISIICHMSACCLLFVQLTQQLLVLLCTSFRSHREVSWCERRKESERKREKRFLGRRERELETEQQRTKTTQISNKPQTSNCPSNILMAWERSSVS